jgi:hypothetical protein
LPDDGTGTLAAQAFVSDGGSAQMVLDVSGYFAVPGVRDETP